ncbi:MAG TPA: phenylalanine--tRNA ligase subunit alpha [Vicinamibacterales bacterium]|nr:phenylalanine--tRNA ligase subunit alpha [Vicinamibacterales bacterium]
MMIDAIETLRRTALADIEAAASPDDLEQVRVGLLGRSGRITEILKSLGGLPADQRKSVGAVVNALKTAAAAKIEERKAALLAVSSVLAQPLDVTVPGTAPIDGGLHPTIQMMYDLNDAFAALNFEIFEGPEITSELYEFDHMNFPPDHPARESMDSYWLAGRDDKRGPERLCVRPHLTGASVRYMQRQKPPFRFAYPGRVFRNETTDARHERAFFQYEALIVEKNLPFSAGQLLIRTVLDTVFGRPVKTRMRAGFFPFVEPGFEIDMQCQVCLGEGCSLCKHIGWLEIMPGGMPHPNVFRAGNIDPDEWMGFYINVGLDRLVMMRYGIDDVRLFHSSDVRFLSQFR